MADVSTTLDNSKLLDVSTEKHFKNNKSDDLLVQNLILALDQAIKKEKRTLKTKNAEKFQRIYYKFYFLKYITIFVYMVMIIFEVPTW